MSLICVYNVERGKGKEKALHEKVCPKLDHAGQQTYFIAFVIVQMSNPLMISFKEITTPTTCPICVAALKAWQTPPLSDSLQQYCLTSSVSHTHLMEMADHHQIQSQKRREMSNADLIGEFPTMTGD